MNIEGKIKTINETQTFGSNGFRKRELVITTEEQYPQDILIELVQDKCDILNSFQVGDKVDVGINLRGREWINPQGEAKYFNSIQGWKINKLGDNGNIQPQNQDHPGNEPFKSIPQSELNEESDGLPF